MLNPLLTTKLAIPPVRPNVVSRDRLLYKLDEGYQTGSRLFLICAPAGYGKTTLAARWAVHLGTRPESQGVPDRPQIAWVTLDEKDNDPLLFCSYLAAALRAIDPDLGRSAAGLLEVPLPSGAGLSFDAVGMSLVNDLAAWAGCLLLVLDDYQQIESRPLHQLVSFLVEHLPRNAAILIAARSDPPLPLPRLRARNLLTEIRPGELRFSEEEAAEFLTRAMGLTGLTAENIANLASRTEGWAAGLQLAALSLRGRADVPAFIAEFNGTNRFIFDYLAEEILSHQPPEVQEFLLQTSFLERFNAELCEAVIGNREPRTELRNSEESSRFPLLGFRFSSSRSILDYLESSNLFIIPLDPDRTWYRYHRLFAEFLRSRFKQVTSASTWTGPQVRDLADRASHWFEEHGLLVEAIELALQSQDLERSARLIASGAYRTLMMPGQGRMVLGWLRGLPDRLVRDSPRLSLARAWALLTSGELDEAESTLDQIPPGKLGEEGPGLAGEEAAARALVAVLKGNIQTSIQFSRRALDLLPEAETFLRALIALDLGLAYDNLADIPAAIQSFQQAYTISQALDSPMLAMTALSQLGDMKVLQGKLRDAAGYYRQAIQASTRPGGQLPFAGIAYVRLGRIQYEMNDLKSAADYLEMGIELGRRWESADILVACDTYLALVRAAEGDEKKARGLLRRADLAMEKKMVSSASITVARAVEAQILVSLGEVSGTARWVGEAQGHGLDQPAYLRDIEGAALARVYLAQKSPKLATQILESLIPEAEQAGRSHHLIELLALSALGHAELGQSELAKAALRKALSLAAPEGYQRVFLDEGEGMRLLIKKTSPGKDRFLLAYIDGLLSAFIGPTVESQSTLAGQPGQAISHQGSAISPIENLIEPVSEREIDVLRLIAQGLSNQEIAGHLYVAVSTVKTHINNIYGKLGVKTRIQAVEKARRMKLIS
ncbi:MAG TPA: LuxR C-terminal-related transcriptional regulator [Anaerolineaceae bacterium]|nr:LuxR C-terminal-related transcriptional regulator [Anaerolineaceae bacterium]